MPPRAVFTNNAPFFIRAKARASIMPSVSLVRGQWIDTKSDCASNSSSVTERAPRRAISSALTYGS